MHKNFEGRPSKTAVKASTFRSTIVSMSCSDPDTSSAFLGISVVVWSFSVESIAQQQIDTIYPLVGVDWFCTPADYHPTPNAAKRKGVKRTGND